MKSYFKNLLKAKKKCPFCGTNLRFPSNKKKLKITCPVCKNSFIIEFSRFPYIQWNKNLTILENLKNSKNKFLLIYKENPVIIWLWTFILVMVLFMLFRLFFPSAPPVQENLQLPSSNDIPV